MRKAQEKIEYLTKENHFRIEEIKHYKTICNLFVNQIKCPSISKIMQELTREEMKAIELEKLYCNNENMDLSNSISEIDHQLSRFKRNVDAKNSKYSEVYEAKEDLIQELRFAIDRAINKEKKISSSAGKSKFRGSFSTPKRATRYSYTSAKNLTNGICPPSFLLIKSKIGRVLNRLN